MLSYSLVGSSALAFYISAGVPLTYFICSCIPEQLKVRSSVGLAWFIGVLIDDVICWNKKSGWFSHNYENLTNKSHGLSRPAISCFSVSCFSLSSFLLQKSEFGLVFKSQFKGVYVNIFENLYLLDTEFGGNFLPSEIFKISVWHSAQSPDFEISESFRSCKLCSPQSTTGAACAPFPRLFPEWTLWRGHPVPGCPCHHLSTHLAPCGSTEQGPGLCEDSAALPGTLPMAQGAPAGAPW